MAVLDKFREKLESALNYALPIICEELVAIKHSYFSETGKEGWKPLAPATIARKLRGNSGSEKIQKDHTRLPKGNQFKVPSDNARKFNIEYGYLRNSIQVTYELHQDELRLSVEAHHREGDQAIEQLIYEYGRNFFNFDEKEIEFIVRRLRELIAESFR